MDIDNNTVQSNVIFLMLKKEKPMFEKCVNLTLVSTRVSRNKIDSYALNRNIGDNFLRMT
jgi:hypothetical protein